MVRDRDREQRRDNEEENGERQLRSGLQVVETLIGGLSLDQGWDGKSEQMTYKTSEEYKNTSAE